jgi:hypothetical protein
MTTHDIPSRRCRRSLAVGASVALGLIVSVGLQMSADSMPVASSAHGDRMNCPTPVVL